VVGVVKDIRNVPLGQITEPAIYFSTRQFPFREVVLTVRAADASTAVGGLVIRQSAVLIVSRLLVGIVVVRAAESALARVLFEVSPSDTTSTLLASGVLLVAALMACIPPALRAMRVDPVVGLRAE